jgi:flagellin-like hook-associated protein FlgL
VTYGAAGSTAEVGSLNTDFQSILEQIDKLITDASYKGNNLLKGSNDSVVKFNEDGSSSITVTGLDLGVTSKTALKFTLDADGYDFTVSGGITQALTDTAAAITELRSISATFGADMGVIQTRETFTSELVNVLESGAGKLVNANLEEESANMLALQTRQALGIQALSISNQSNQSILSLFR